MSAPGSASRALSWEGCCNIRDLGGLPTEDGAETRFRAVVRADDISLLSSAGWEALAGHFPALPGARQIFDMAVDLVQTSCGYAVPFMEFSEDRQVLASWAEKKGPEGLADYWAEKNAHSIDGKPTGIGAARP